LVSALGVLPHKTRHQNPKNARTGGMSNAAGFSYCFSFI
jgi:hypothetical protein